MVWTWNHLLFSTYDIGNGDGNSWHSEEEMEYKDFDYTPNLKRSISIIDPETTEEVKPVLYFDEKTNEVKGKCKLKPYKSYFAFEIREGK